MHLITLRRVSIWTLLLALGLGSTGCGSITKSDAPATTEWWLVPAQLSPATASLRWPLVLSLDVVPGLDTDRILNLNDSARLNSYGGALWPDPLPEVLQSVVQRSLETIGDSPVRIGSRADDQSCMLKIEIREFFGRVNSNEVTHKVELDMHGELNCPDFSRQLASRQSVTVAENRMGVIVAAFQQALDTGLQELADQLEPRS